MSAGLGSSNAVKLPNSEEVSIDEPLTLREAGMGSTGFEKRSLLGISNCPGDDGASGMLLSNAGADGTGACSVEDVGMRGEALREKGSTGCPAEADGAEDKALAAKELSSEGDPRDVAANASNGGAATVGWEENVVHSSASCSAVLAVTETAG